MSRFLRKKSSGSMLSLAAVSSSAPMVITAACGWFGARHAREGPWLVAIAVYCLRWLGMSKTYGSGGDPPPPGPPVPQPSDCQPVRRPSFEAATLTRAYAEGRAPATSSSASRSSMIFTALPCACLASCAEATPQRSMPNLLPKPPPMYCCSTRMLSRRHAHRLRHLRRNAAQVLRGDVHLEVLVIDELRHGAVRFKAAMGDHRNAVNPFGNYAAGFRRREGVRRLALGLRGSLLIRRLHPAALAHRRLLHRRDHFRRETPSFASASSIFGSGASVMSTLADAPRSLRRRAPGYLPCRRSRRSTAAHSRCRGFSEALRRRRECGSCSNSTLIAFSAS